MAKITTLTPAQWADVERMRDEWLAHGLSTAPADRAAAEATITEMYRLIGRDAPRFLWVDSPVTANLVIWLFDGKLGKLTSLDTSLLTSLHTSLHTNWAYLWDQMDAYWIASCQVPERLDIVTCTPEDSRRLELWATLARSCGWWWPYDGWCIISERPREVHTEPTGANDGSIRLHNPTGPAMLFRDSWAVHAWHGTTVPADLIESEGWTPERILSEPNQENRRCAIERIGWDVFVARAGLTQIGESAPDPGNPGNVITLYDVPEQIYDEPVRVMLATNGTEERDGARRRFGMTVPAALTAPVAAAAWGYDDPDSPVRVTPEVYAQIARRT
jgi:hypothetical protein